MIAGLAKMTVVSRFVATGETGEGSNKTRKKEMG